MAGYKSSCDGAWPLSDGTMVNLVVQSNGDDRFSRIYRVAGLQGAGTSKVELLGLNEWLTGLWCDDTPNLMVTSETGQVHHLLDGEWTARSVSDRSLVAVWGFSHDRCYAVGDAGIVYRWDGAAWRGFSESFGQTVFDVRGISEDDVYACGGNGLLVHWNGSTWSQIDLGTNMRLLGLCPVDSDEAWVCGTQGSLYRGYRGAWEEVRLTSTDLHGVAMFQGKLHIAGSTDGVLRLDGDLLTNIKNTVISYGVETRGGFLASAGDGIAIRYDGTSWAGLRYD